MGLLIVGAHRGAGKFDNHNWVNVSGRVDPASPTAGGDAGVNEGARGAWRTPR